MESRITFFLRERGKLFKFKSIIPPVVLLQLALTFLERMLLFPHVLLGQKKIYAESRNKQIK